MLTEIYIEALLVDKEMADQVWEAWISVSSATNVGEFSLSPGRKQNYEQSVELGLVEG